MRRRVKIAIRSVVVVLVVMVPAGSVVRFRYECGLAHEVERLFAASEPQTDSIVGEDDLNHLPAPVQQWLRASGIVGQPSPATVRLKQEGDIRIGDFDWMPFTAEEHYTIDPSSFI